MGPALCTARALVNSPEQTQTKFLQCNAVHSILLTCGDHVLGSQIRGGRAWTERQKPHYYTCTPSVRRGRLLSSMGRMLGSERLERRSVLSGCTTV